jgi:cell division protein FtsB
MNVNVGIWGPLTRVVVLLLLLAAVIGDVIWYLPVIRENQAMRQQILQLNLRIQEQAETARRLKARIDSLRDPRTVERMARERLGYARPGETVIRFEAPGTNSPSPEP